MASRTRSTVRPCAFSFSMSRMIWISRAWPPEMVTSPTPSTVATALPDLLVGDLRQRPERQRAGQREADDRVRVRIDLRDDRRLHLRRQLLERLGDLLPHVLCRVVDVPLQDEPERDPAVALADERLHLVDARDAAERLLGGLDDRAVQFLGAGARQVEKDDDGRGIRFGEEIDAEIAEGEHARHDEQHHEHRREDGPPDAEIS